MLSKMLSLWSIIVANLDQVIDYSVIIIDYFWKNNPIKSIIMDYNQIKIHYNGL